MIRSIVLKNFRSHSDKSFEFDPECTIISGPNAAGKTNILEAIYLAAQGNSFRGRDIEVIHKGSDWTRVDAFFDDHEHTVIIENKGDKIQKRFVIDNTGLSRLALSRKIPIVLFEPTHMQLIHGSPELRRAFLDDILSQSIVGYNGWLQHYKRALAQRNSLLKLGYERAKNQLFAWDVRLSDLGSRIAFERNRASMLLNEQVQTLYPRIAGTATDVMIAYKLFFKEDTYASSMLHTLEINQQKDCERGFTSVGPHREDVSIILHNSPAAEVASRGETRTIILTLKISSLYHIEEALGKKPILLLDDVYSELDTARREFLGAVLSQHQTIITSTNADSLFNKSVPYTIRL